MKKVLLSAATYRKFWFESNEELIEYLEGGHLYRWLVEKRYLGNGSVVAIVGERYNRSRELKMEKEVNE